MKDPRDLKVVVAEANVWKEPDVIQTVSQSTPESGRAQDAPSMVERVAIALREKMEHLDPTETGEVAWADLSERDRDFYRLSVKAVLEAIREPDRAMILAGESEIDDCLDHDYSSDIDGNRHEYTTLVSGSQTKVYRAMIDEALKPLPEPPK